MVIDWCFGYEQLNGFLAGIPNSKVNVEPQIMNTMLLQFSYASSTQPVIPSSSDVPKNLKCVTVIETLDAFHIRHLNSILLEPLDSRFAFQRKIDQGNVADWPIELLHPSKCNLKIDTVFYEELVEFCKNTYMYVTEVHIHTRMDKFASNMFQPLRWRYKLKWKRFMGDPFIF